MLEELIKDINVKKGISNCGDSEEFYIEILGDYARSSQPAKMCENFKAQDWKKYAVNVHSLKSTSRTVGLDSFGDMCESMQHAAERCDTEYILAHHSELIGKYNEISRSIISAVG